MRPSAQEHKCIRQKKEGRMGPRQKTKGAKPRTCASLREVRYGEG